MTTMGLTDKNSELRGAVIDGILKLLVTSSVLGVAVIAPNMIQVLDKPMARFFDKMDKRSQEREVRKALYYMRRQDLIASLHNYDHGIRLKAKGKKRLQKVELKTLTITKPKHWDKKWRIVFYDIPERYKLGRDALTRKLKDLGFYQLQRSVLAHQYPCRDEIAAVTLAYGVSRFVSYIETDHIDQQKLLLKKLKNNS